MAASAVHVRGLQELQRDFRKMRGDLKSETRDALKKAAEPVREEAADLFQGIDARSASGYKVRVRGKGVVVQQSRRGRKYKRPNYTRMQLGIALYPALDRRRDDVIEGLGEMIDQLAGANGF